MMKLGGKQRDMDAVTLLASSIDGIGLFDDLFCRCLVADVG